MEKIAIFFVAPMWSFNEFPNHRVLIKKKLTLVYEQFKFKKKKQASIYVKIFHRNKRGKQKMKSCEDKLKWLDKYKMACRSHVFTAFKMCFLIFLLSILLTLRLSFLLWMMKTQFEEWNCLENSEWQLVWVDKESFRLLLLT